jgi:glutamate synthase (NADPH/NADH) large chain
MGLDQQAIERRVAKGAKVSLQPLGPQSKTDLTQLLGSYKQELLASGQPEEAAKIDSLLGNLDAHFIRISPVGMQADQSVATE